MSAREKLIKFMKNEAQKPMAEKELYNEFEISKDEQKTFTDLLNQLVKEGVLFKSDKNKYGIPEKFKLILGRIERNPRGFAFLIPEDPEQEDIYIGVENMNGAMHNDKVFISISPHSRSKRREGEVVKVLERANHTIVGTLEKKSNSYFAFVVPDNKRLFFDVFVPEKELNEACNGQKVVTEIIRWPEKNRNPEGKIIEILGFREEVGVDIEAIIRQLELPGEFPAEVKEEARIISEEISTDEIVERRDLRGYPMVTIDGDDAKDFDDAVSIEELEDGILRLGVHIADVTHYVKEDSPLDKEAVERGTSIYLVDRVIPMLPEKLSNGICSLKPGEDRLCVSVFIDYSLEPVEITNYEIFTSVINSNHRLTYDQVRRILKGEEDHEFAPQLLLMNKLRKKLRKERFDNGGIDFDFPEVEVILNDEGKPVELKIIHHGESEQLIEEFMIAANRVIAEDMFWRDIPFIYRVHDQPDKDRIMEFNEFIHNFGYHLKGVKNDIHPGALQDLLQKVKGEDVERIIETVLLRTMKKAQYSGKNIGHFGLALEYYTHFTSPIRRYPDLMIHRVIKEVLENGKLSNKRLNELEHKIPLIADHSSLQERRAMEAERDTMDLKKIEFMEDKVGFEYNGIISGMINFGFFVELDNYVEGLVHVENLTDDYYYFKPEQMAMIGERTGKIYRLGDKVKVKVDRVNLDERQLDLKLLEG